MRILLVSQEYPPETAHGGIGSQTWTKAYELARRGRAGWEYARDNFSRQGFAEQFEAVLRKVAGPEASHPWNGATNGSSG